MHSLNLTQETLKLLMQVKRILKHDYNISVHLQSENLAEQIAEAISASHDENLYHLACDLWDELEKTNDTGEARTELRIQRDHLVSAWHHDSSTVH